MAPNEWDDFAGDWDSNDDAQTYAQKAFDSWIQNVFPLISDLSISRILDFGCGTGLLTEKFAPIVDEIVAVDTSARMIELLQRKTANSVIDNVTALQITVNTATINERPELADKFDLIVASSVCSFLSDYEGTLDDLASVISGGGYFVQWDWLADMPVKRIRSAFEASGLISQSIEEAFALDAHGESMSVVMGVGRKRA